MTLRTLTSLFVLPLLCGSACTESEGEVGVFVAPARGPERPDGSVVPIPPRDAHVPLPEASPGRCEPGRYEGTFNCNFGFGQSCTQNPGTGGIVITGPLTLMLQTSGEFLAVSGATLDASSGGYMLSGPLSGVVDCRVKKFVGSFDGKYSGPALPPLPVPTVQGELSGPLTANYDSRQPALTNGEWCLTATSPNTSRTDPCADIPTGQPGSCLLGSCKGTWTTVKVPGT